MKQYIAVLEIDDDCEIVGNIEGSVTFTYNLNGTNYSLTESVDFVTTEQWDYITFPAPTGKRYKNCEVKIVASPSGNYLVDSKVRVKNLYVDMQYKVYSTNTGALPFDQTIKEISTGTFLNAL